MKQVEVIIEAGRPLRFTDATVSDVVAPGGSLVAAMAKTLSAYRDAAATLVNGKYAGQRALAPLNMRTPCDIFILRCTDGIFVRYDSVSGAEAKTRCMGTDKCLAEVSPPFSEQVVHFPEDPQTYVPAAGGPEITLTKTSAKDGTVQEIAKSRPLVFAKKTFPEGFQIEPPPARPPTLVCVHNEFGIHLEGTVLPADAPVMQLDGPDAQQFIARRFFKLKVGWETIEIYPLLGGEHWKPEYARQWAELDLLAAIAQRNLQDLAIASLDSRAETRRRFSTVLDEFAVLLEGKEEPIHQFLKRNPGIFCQTYDHWWSKVPFGKGEGKRVSDFVFREPHNDYLLVEIEAPSRKLFRKDGQQCQDLTHAINQIADWVQYIGNNKREVEEDLGLRGISTNPRTLVVIGRSASLTEENRRKLVTLQAQQNKLRILTYDDLIATARANLDRLFGPLDQGQNEEVYYFKK